MNSIEKKVMTLTEINKSKFYSILIPLNNINEVHEILANIKNEYKNATHYCYAYIFDQTKRFNDDGEPNGTAGIPILSVLENNNLNHILAVVVRYFGGIKLGAGGLVRAYTNSVSEALNNSNIIKLIKGVIIKIEFTYENTKQIDYLLKNEEITEKNYSNNITYTINTKNLEIINIIKKYIKDYKILSETYIIEKNND